MLKRAIRIELDQCLMELKINLENNYKDLAHDALKQLHEKLETFYQNGSIKEKDYKKYEKSKGNGFAIIVSQKMPCL